MKGIKVYLAGPITGIANDNCEEFSRIKKLLEVDDFDVISPFDLKIPAPSEMTTTDDKWNYYMRNCLFRLLRGDIEIIFLMDGWEDSRGATTEAFVAKKAGIKVLRIFEKDGKLSYKEKDEEKEDILTEANNLVNGDRNNAYGHPLDDYTKTSSFWNILLKDKLKAPLIAEDAIMCMIAVKMSREMNKHKSDNLIDLAGYAQCLQKTILKRRELEKNTED